MPRRPRIFLISPAAAHGARARALLADDARTPLALRLREPPGVPLGAVFRYLSGLYFNGKLAYATAFARPPRTGIAPPGIFVITFTDGLLTPETSIGIDDLRRFAAAEEGGNAAGRATLVRSARSLARTAGEACDAIFLGSLAEGKYTDALLPAFGARLQYPRALRNIGQLDRGALLFRCVRDGRELEYEPVAELGGAASQGRGGAAAHEPRRHAAAPSKRRDADRDARA